MFIHHHNWKWGFMFIFYYGPMIPSKLHFATISYIPYKFWGTSSHFISFTPCLPSEEPHTNWRITFCWNICREQLFEDLPQNSSQIFPSFQASATSTKSSTKNMWETLGPFLANLMGFTSWLPDWATCFIHNK